MVFYTVFGRFSTLGDTLGSFVHCVEETGYQHILNMAAKSAIERGISTIWQKILTVVNNALVYLDSRTAEWIHWCGSLQDFIDAGALNVCDISSARVSTAAP